MDIIDQPFLIKEPNHKFNSYKKYSSEAQKGISLIQF